MEISLRKGKVGAEYRNSFFSTTFLDLVCILSEDMGNLSTADSVKSYIFYLEDISIIYFII